MQEGEPGHTVKKCHDSGTGIQALLVRLPRLQCAAGNLKPRGGLPLRDALGLEITILRKQIGTFEALPALVAIIVASGLILDYCSRRCLLLCEFARKKENPSLKRYIAPPSVLSVLDCTQHADVLPMSASFSAELPVIRGRGRSHASSCLFVRDQEASCASHF